MEKPCTLVYYRYKQDKNHYIYVLKYRRMNFWQRLYDRIYDYPPHIDIWYEKVLIVYED